MGAAEEAARLRKQADALDVEAELESELSKAKEAYRKNPDSAKAKERHRAASQAIAEHRAARRPDTLSIGGDAFVSTSEGNEG